MFFPNRNIAATFLPRCVCTFGWFVPCRQRVVRVSVSSTELVILFRLAVRGFSTEAYNSTLRCCSGRNWSKIGVHKMRQKSTPNWTFALHLRTLTAMELLTSNNSPRNSGTLLMGCVTASGAPRSSRRHPEATHEVFSWTRTCEPAARKPPKIANTTQFTRVA